MHVSVETLAKLERKVTVEVPAEQIQEEVGSRLKKIASTVKMDGYRSGKVPMSAIQKRYMNDVWEEVSRDMVSTSLRDALKEHHLQPAGQPYVEPTQLITGKNFIYTATFEVFPEFKINELKKSKVEVVTSDIQDDDLTNMLDRLLADNKVWAKPSRDVVESGDKVFVDFEGTVGGKPFDRNSAKNIEIIIGSQQMVPGFEEAIIGAQQGKPFDFKVTFPADYHESDLASKEATFNMTVVRILEGTLPPLDDAFAEKMNIKAGGVDALKKDIKENMARELQRKVSLHNRKNTFDALLEKNKFDIPQSLVEEEIKHLKHDLFHRLSGSHHTENETIPDFPRALFEEDAQRRVHLGLLFADYVKLHDIVVDPARVDMMIDNMANAYDDPDELRKWYRENDERLAEIEALVMEEMVVDKILEDASVVKKIMSYNELMNPKHDTTQVSEGE